MKPPALIQGTWGEPKEAAAWLGAQLAEYAPRFIADSDRDRNRLATLLNSTAERLCWGGDVSLGCYLERPSFLSLALVTCSPNRVTPDHPCPAASDLSQEFAGVAAPHRF